MGQLGVLHERRAQPRRLASILALFGEVADEIVVAVEEPRALATHDAVAHVVDWVCSFPPTEPL